MIAVTAAQLKAAAPTGNPQIIAAIATTSAAVFAKYKIDNYNRVIAFLSVIIEESGLNTLFENMNYTAARAHVVWPSIFPTVADAEPFANNPQALANKVYGKRMGNVGPNDGWLYRGQGLEQITGKSNFELLAKLTGLDIVNHPEIVTALPTMLECAVALFCQFPGILAYCDAGSFSHVWALVGTGKATGPVINLANHETALAAVRRAIPALADAPVASAVPTSVAAPVIAPIDRVLSVQHRLDKAGDLVADKNSLSPEHEGLFQKVEASVEGFLSRLSLD